MDATKTSRVIETPLILCMCRVPVFFVIMEINHVSVNMLPRHHLNWSVIPQTL